MSRSRMFHFPNISIVEADIKVNVNLDRFEKQFQDAQLWLDDQVWTGTKKYIPQRDGMMIDTTNTQNEALKGSGKVYAGYGPYVRYLYMGKVMVDPETGSPWARPGAKKVVTDRDIQFSKEPNPFATDHWFDDAKDEFFDTWVKGVKKRAGGG